MDDVAEALHVILANGLPIPPGYDDERLLGLSCVLERCLDPTDRLNRVTAADELLQEVIDAYPSDVMGRSASLLFGATPDSCGRTLTKRRTLARRACNLKDERHFRENIETKIVDMLAWLVVQRTLKTTPRRLVDLLPSEVRQHLQQLYRHAQETLLYLETFTVMALTVAALGKFSDLPHRAGKASIGNESLYTENGLWVLANCLVEFRAVDRDSTGSRFLSTGLPPKWWISKLDRAMSNGDVDLIAAALSDSRDGRELARRIRESPEGRRTEDRWLQLLSSVRITSGIEPDAGDREDLRTRLVILCQFLETVFPEDKRSPVEMEMTYDSIIYDMLTNVGELATYKSSEEETMKVKDLIYAARSKVPRHYVFGEPESPQLLP